MRFKTRVAPSPTGKPHLGTIRSALISYLFSLKANGEFILRIDDTDVDRCTKEYEESIINNLDWLSIKYKYKIKQTERLEIYDFYFKQLVKNGWIYDSYENEEDLEKIRNNKRIEKKPPIFTREDRFKNEGNPHWRFDLKDNNFHFRDLINKDLYFNRSWSDPVVKRSNGSYTYMFTSVVDDIKEDITHIIRGSDHLSNTPIQLKIGEAILGEEWKVNFAHYPIFLDKDGGKLSKRNNSLNIENLINKGIEKMTFYSVLSYLGTNKPQIFSDKLEDYVDNFDINSFSTASQKIGSKEIEEFFLKTNIKVLRGIPVEELENRKVDLSIWEGIKFNISSFGEYREWENIINSIELEYIYPYGKEISDLLLKDNPKEVLDTIIVKYSLNKKDFLQSLQIALTGKRSGPSVYDILKIIKERMFEKESC